MAPRTVTGQLVEKIRSDIINGHFEAGARLKLNVLAERYSSSPTPLREALSRLVNQGLLVVEEQKGFRVAPISREDLIDITKARVDIESLLLRRSIDNGDINWEARVIAASHKLSRLLMTKDRKSLNPDWELAHTEYHAALISACNSAWLLRFGASLWEQHRRYRRLSLKHDFETRDTATEHAAITAAVLARKADKACALLSQHFWKTTETLLEYSKWADDPAPANTPSTSPGRSRRVKSVPKRAGASAEKRLV